LAARNFRVDAWVTPPTYPGRPPVILPGLRSGESVQYAGAAIAVPTGSTLVVRATGKVGLDVTTSGGVNAAHPDQQPASPAGTEERRFTITSDGSASVRGGSDVTWHFTAIPDRPPTIALAKDPEPQVRGALQLSYKLEDDYGVSEAQATFTRKDTQAPAGNTPRPLYGAPDFALVLPQARTRNGVGQTTK